MTQEPQTLAQLIITLQNTGQVLVTGPIHDKTLCYGLLGQAADAIRAYVDEQQKSAGLTIVRQPLNGNSV